MSDSVAKWLEQIGLSQYAAVFAENEITREFLPELDHDTLKELGVAVMGHRMAIMKAAKLLPSDDAEEMGDEPAAAKKAVSSASTRTANQAERRQLTVMFCDLVGSTDLSGRLDPEDLREVVRAYQKAAEQVIQKFGGHIAQYLGDGLLVYFGYPVAHENDAQRAVYAGIGIPRAINNLNSQLQADYSVSLSVRIGIHTGPVVVGEMGGGERQENLAMGETPNLAARLEGLAQPDTVVISGNTQRLLGELFALDALGEQNLKGIADPVQAFAVTGERLAETRFAAGQSDGVSALVGRQQELALLLDRWRQAKAGEGQMVVLTGEAGIGKSHIMSALVESLASEDHQRISYQCSPYHTDSSLYPAIQQLTYAAGFSVNDSPEVKLDKLESVLRQRQEDISDTVPLLGALLGLGEVAEARHGAPAYSPAQRREKTLQVLIDQLTTGATAKRPLLFVLEDAHWIDPTTLELIELLLEQLGAHHIMLLITARPTFAHSFGGHPVVSRLALNRLGREPIIAIVARITMGKTLPPALLDEIATKTDGVPLFVEEFTKTLLESGQLHETQQGYTFDGRLDQLTIPSSLHDSLMARLDRMQPIKEVAQTAACIGREFGYDLLAGVSPLKQTDLTAALDQLVAAELIFKRGVAPASTYTFKHALVRDAAYESLLKARRLTIHDALLTQLKAQAATAPELLAHHATEAGRIVPAVGYWEQAGDQAFNRPAVSEAANHFERALQCLELGRKNTAASDDTDNLSRELDLRVKLSHVIRLRHGFGHPFTAAANVAAYELLDSVGETPHRFPVLFNHYVLKFVNGEHASAFADANALCEEAERSADRVQNLIALRGRGTSQIILGDFGGGGATLEQAFAHYDPDQDTQLAWTFGTDIGDALAIYRACSLLLCGEAQLAWDRIATVEDTARERGHVGAYCYALCFLALLNVLGRKAGASRLIKLLAEVTDRHNLNEFKAAAALLSGALLNEEKRYAESVQQMGPAFELMRKAGNAMWRPHLQAIYASGLAALGQFDEARKAELSATSMIERGSEQWAVAEVYRLIADADYWHRRDAEKSIDGLQRAIGIAKGQGAKLWELRATVSLARIWGDQQERSQGVALLTPVVEGFPHGGRDLADMAIAKTVLQELA